MVRRKVLLVELNEVTWDLIDPLIEQGKLPTFARLKREGAWAAPVSVDAPPHLDPWITWTTVYTGRAQEDHNVFFLEQPPETIRAERIWEICHRSGLRVGVYGSLCSWPPQKVNGFYVPDSFAQNTATHPASLEPIQRLNLTYTRSIRLPADCDGLWFKARLGAKLLALGLDARTAARVARQLAIERMNPELRWRRVALQPAVNCDFFSRLHRRYRPHFATFHTNHVAHYMHTYWKAMAPEAFPQATSPDEIRIYGGAIEYGYAAADELLSRMLRRLDDSRRGFEHGAKALRQPVQEREADQSTAVARPPFGDRRFERARARALYDVGPIQHLPRHGGDRRGGDKDFGSGLHRPAEPPDVPRPSRRRLFDCQP